MKAVMDKKPKKLKSEKMPIWAIPEILPFLNLRFFNLFFNFMSQKYQNEKSPIVYGVKKPKTLRKVQRMTVLQAWEFYKMFVNTWYSDCLVFKFQPSCTWNKLCRFHDLVIVKSPSQPSVPLCHVELVNVLCKVHYFLKAKYCAVCPFDIIFWW